MLVYFGSVTIPLRDAGFFLLPRRIKDPDEVKEPAKRSGVVDFKLLLSTNPLNRICGRVVEYGRLENDYSKRVVSSNLTMSENLKSLN